MRGTRTAHPPPPFAGGGRYLGSAPVMPEQGWWPSNRGTGRPPGAQALRGKFRTAFFQVSALACRASRNPRHTYGDDLGHIGRTATARHAGADRVILGERRSQEPEYLLRAGRSCIPWSANSPGLWSTSHQSAQAGLGSDAYQGGVGNGMTVAKPRVSAALVVVSLRTGSPAFRPVICTGWASSRGVQGWTWGTSLA